MCRWEQEEGWIDQGSKRKDFGPPERKKPRDRRAWKSYKKGITRSE